MYLEYIAGYYSFVLPLEQISLIGLIGILVLAAVVIFDLGKRLKPPNKMTGHDFLSQIRCARMFFCKENGSEQCSC